MRRACAVILADLKPSGYDIEDTRMKSDALVDTRDREGASYKQHLQPKAIQAHGPSQRQDAAALSPLRQLRQNDDQARVDSIRLSSNTQAQIASLMAPLESPLAPLPTNAQDSPTGATAAKNKTTRLNSMGSTTSTQYTQVTDPSGETDSSTGVTSVNGTSLAGSKRVSAMNSSASPTSANRAGEWMRQGVQRHLAQQDGVQPQSPTVEGPPKASALRERSEKPPLGHTWSVSSVQSARSESLYSGSEGRPGNSRQLSTDSGRNGVAALSFGKDASIPPVPRMDPARKDKLEGDAAIKAMQDKLAAAGFKDKTDETAAPRRTSTTAAASARQESASTSRPQTASKQPSHGILKHQHDPGVVVQDFWKPSGGAARGDGGRTDPRAGDFDSLMPKHKLAQQQGSQQPQAPSYASGSASVRNHTSNPSVSSSKSRATRAPDIPSRTSSMTGQMQPPTFSKISPGQGASIRAASMTSAVSRGAGFAPLQESVTPNGSALRTVTTQATADQHHNAQSPLSPVDIVYHSPSPDAAAAERYAPSASSRVGASSLNYGKDRRGLSKLLHRFGGNDPSSRKRNHVPPNYLPHNNYMQAGYPDDYWSEDDEVCAAPVVGFGRGW